MINCPKEFEHDVLISFSCDMTFRNQNLFRGITEHIRAFANQNFAVFEGQLVLEYNAPF